MPDLNAELLSEVLAASEAGLEEASAALTRALDGPLTLAAGQGEPLNRESLPEKWKGAGLVVILQVEEQAALVLLPESTGLLPDWYREPDATGQSKLMTLAQELGMLLLPESHMPDGFDARYVSDLAAAVRRGELSDDAISVNFALSHEDGRQGEMFLVWAAGDANRVYGDAPASQPPASLAKEPPAAAMPAEAPDSSMGTSVDKLPNYTRSLLRIRVPLMVNLASKRQPVGRIVELESGAILQFDKSCDEPLDLYLGNQRIAVGEAVKVGDKFGLRISSLVLPDERFRPVQPHQGK